LVGRHAEQVPGPGIGGPPPQHRAEVIAGLCQVAGFLAADALGQIVGNVDQHVKNRTALPGFVAPPLQRICLAHLCFL
jgi:hypothetical protein